MQRSRCGRNDFHGITVSFYNWHHSWIVYAVLRNIGIRCIHTAEMQGILNQWKLRNFTSSFVPHKHFIQSQSQSQSLILRNTHKQTLFPKQLAWKISVLISHNEQEPQCHIKFISSTIQCNSLRLDIRLFLPLPLFALSQTFIPHATIF